ncbi:DNA repair protein RadC [Sporanaerobium hydrogeniformans]|uniref:DNA repair protein RadC n=2 Tax=Sporanaerobium hydrogeniformans TaxID=3072179 RepID=A0AC61D950_9FIRM|nr:DNA repair protein RadC [Sporanaerobium hydrogeniformans]
MVKEGSVLYSARRIQSTSDADELVRQFLDELDREAMIVVALNTKSEPTCLQVISIGSLSASIVHPREVFKVAILSNAYSILLAHNHPSGDTTPSQEDIKLTKRIKNASDIMGISLLDHLIIGSDGYYSFKENGEL